MPNYCNNRLTVLGPPADVKRFVDFATGEEVLDFDKLCPMPPEYLLDDTWYDWRMTHWNTKWECCGGTIDETDINKGGVVYDFLTAWSPPEGVIKAAARKFDMLNFWLEYAEPGMNFSGTMWACGDTNLSEYYEDISLTNYGRELYEKNT